MSKKHNNKKQFGGVIFENTTISPFDFIMDKIIQKNCTIKLLSDTSLHAFVLAIYFNNTNSVSKGLNNTSTRFNKKIQ